MIKVPEVPEGEPAVVFPIIELTVVEDLDFLPYFPAHTAFIAHTEECQRCHVGAFHPETVADDEDLFCETGDQLRAEVRGKILEQRALSMLN